MKLYLSSYRIPDPDAFFKFVGKGRSLKMALIYNAHDYTPANLRAEKYAERTAYFRELGFTIIDIDLRRIASSDELRQKLLAVDVIWANGGNSYDLRYAMKTSGFDQIVKPVLESGVVYGGDSAGAVVVGPTLKYLEAADSPENAPEVIYEGIGLTDIAVVPHWGSEKFAAILGTIQASLVGDGYNVQILADDQALCIEDGAVSII